MLEKLARSRDVRGADRRLADPAVLDDQRAFREASSSPRSARWWSCTASYRETRRQRRGRGAGRDPRQGRRAARLRGRGARAARPQLGAEEKLRLELVPKDPNDGRNVVLEIRAGTGGDEASLFAAELFRMYFRYAETQGWRVEIIDLSESEAGGIKEVSAIVEGRGA